MNGVQVIFQLGFVPEDDELYELTPEQYQAYYDGAEEEEEDISYDEKVYMLLPKDPQKYSEFAAKDVFVLAESDIILIKKAEELIEKYVVKSGKKFSDFEEKLRYVASVMPAVASDGTKYSRESNLSSNANNQQSSNTPVEYVNRRKEKTYLKKAPTKSGKIQYCAIKNISKIKPEELLDYIPDGYEFYENPRDAQVYFRRIPVYNISDAEVEIVDSVMKNHEIVSDYIIEKGVNEITIFVSQINKNDDQYSGYPYNLKKSINFYLRYEDVMKFKKSGKMYHAQRFCWRSSIDDWITLEKNMDLRYLVEKYCHHIGRDSYYELG